MLKTFGFFSTLFALIIAAGHLFATRVVLDFKHLNQMDTADYRLHIDQAKISPLKDTIFNRDKCWITYCPLTLTNNSADTLKYLTMSASWWDLYSLNNQNFALAADWWNVFKNGPVLIVLPPHQAVTKSIPVITYTDYYRGQRLRIAMSLQRLGFELRYIMEPKSKTTNMIWSNEVTIQ